VIDLTGFETNRVDRHGRLGARIGLDDRPGYAETCRSRPQPDTIWKAGGHKRSVRRPDEPSGTYPDLELFGGLSGRN